MTSLARQFSNRAARGGFIAADTLAAIMLATVLLMVIASAVVKQQAGEKRLAAKRTAVRDVEGSLLLLQAGAATTPDTRVDRLPDAAPPGQVWVRLTRDSHDQRPAASLVGLVPVNTLEKGARP